MSDWRDEWPVGTRVRWVPAPSVDGTIEVSKSNFKSDRIGILWDNGFRYDYSKKSVNQHITKLSNPIAQPNHTTKGDIKCCDGYPYCHCDELLNEDSLETIEIELPDKDGIAVSTISHPDIVNPIHYDDTPQTKEEIDRMWEVTKNLCK